MTELPVTAPFTQVLAIDVVADDVEQPIVLEPLRKFPVVRDLVVDRQRMFDGLKTVEAWIEIDGAYVDRHLSELAGDEDLSRYIL